MSAGLTGVTEDPEVRLPLKQCRQQHSNLRASDKKCLFAGQVLYLLALECSFVEPIGGHF
jgi:hypothetical protein